MAGEPLVSRRSAPDAVRLTRSVCPRTRSRTNTSVTVLVSPATRSDAFEEKATYRPSGVIAMANPLLALPGAPSGRRLIRS